MDKTVKSILIFLCGIGIMFGGLNSVYADSDSYYLNPNNSEFSSMPIFSAPNYYKMGWDIGFSGIKVTEADSMFISSQPVIISDFFDQQKQLLYLFWERLDGAQNYIVVVYDRNSEKELSRIEEILYDFYPVELPVGFYKIGVIAVNEKGEQSKETIVDYVEIKPVSLDTNQGDLVVDVDDVSETKKTIRFSFNANDTYQPDLWNEDARTYAVNVRLLWQDKDGERTVLDTGAFIPKWFNGKDIVYEIITPVDGVAVGSIIVEASTIVMSKEEDFMYSKFVEVAEVEPNPEYMDPESENQLVVNRRMFTMAEQNARDAWKYCFIDSLRNR